MRALSSTFSAAFAVMVLMLGCNDDKPKAQAKPAGSPEPIPEDLVFNAGLDDKAAAAKLAFVTDSGAGDGGASAMGSTAKLVSAGADPKAPLVYAFSTKARTVTAMIKMAATNAPTGTPEQPPFKFTFTATPKPLFGLAGSSTIDVKVTKLEIVMPPNSPPQASAGKDQLEKALVGVTGHFDSSSHGDIDNLDFQTGQAAQGVSEIVGVMEQALELLVVPLPNEPVGIGAKWMKTETKRMADQGTTTSTTVNITLLARDQTTATLKVDAANSGTVTVNDPRAPKGTVVQRTTAASYTVIIRLDGVAQKVDGEAKNDMVQKVPGQPEQTLSVKVTQNLDSK
jgi:hypothetical protein